MAGSRWQGGDGYCLGRQQCALCPAPLPRPGPPLSRDAGFTPCGLTFMDECNFRTCFGDMQILMSRICPQNTACWGGRSLPLATCGAHIELAQTIFCWVVNCQLSVVLWINATWSVSEQSCYYILCPSSGMISEVPEGNWQSWGTDCPAKPMISPMTSLLLWLTCHVAVDLCGPQRSTSVWINGEVAWGAAHLSVGLAGRLIDSWRENKVKRRLLYSFWMS